MSNQINSNVCYCQHLENLYNVKEGTSTDYKKDKNTMIQQEKKGVQKKKKNQKKSKNSKEIVKFQQNIDGTNHIKKIDIKVQSIYQFIQAFTRINHGSNSYELTLEKLVKNPSQLLMDLKIFLTNPYVLGSNLNNAQKVLYNYVKDLCYNNLSKEKYSPVPVTQNCYPEISNETQLTLEDFIKMEPCELMQQLQIDKTISDTLQMHLANTSVDLIDKLIDGIGLFLLDLSFDKHGNYIVQILLEKTISRKGIFLDLGMNNFESLVHNEYGSRVL